ncbi:MAG: hypothetical protein M1818_002746 [Claussenomyces sp. TS43310]|nr:MAG: hypothetical protein M1818_002746 [Claussenomyces sp. TS43310]
MTRNAVRFSQIVSSDSEAENGSDLRSCPIVSSKRPQRFSARAARPSLSSRTGNRATTSGYGSNENKIRAKEEGEEEDEDEDLLARQLTATVSQRENVRKVSRTSSSTSSSAKPRVARKMNRRDEVATTSIINKYFKKDSESKPPFQKGIVTDDTDDDVVVGMPKVPIRPQSVSPTAKILSSTKAGSPIPLVRRRDPVQKSIYSFFGEGANSMYNNHGSLSSLPSGGLETSPSNEDLDGKKSFFTQPDENVGDGVSHPLVSSSRTTSSEDAVNGLSRDLSPEAPVNTAPSSPPTSPEPIPEEVSRKFPTRSTRNRQPKFIEAISDIEESDRGDHSDFIDPSSDETNSDIEPDISEDDSDDSDIKPCAKRLKRRFWSG